MHKEKQALPRETPAPSQGLTQAAVKERTAAGLSNRVSDPVLLSDKQIILKNAVTFFNMIFVIMAVFLLLFGSSIIKLTFLVVVIINTIIGCVQEIRAKRAVAKLTLVAARPVTVVREGNICKLPPEKLVRDDIVEFSHGQQLCADGILRTGQLHVNESLITGEADAIVKNPGDKLLSGSFVVAGKGRAQLTQVGDDAFAAKLAAEAKKDPTATKSEMMRALDKLIRVIGFALIPIGGILFYQEYVTLNLSLRDSAEATAAALVGMVPEGLYLLTSIALAASSLKLSKQRVLVQDMNCIESLARVDVLCVDKTGTITEPFMEVTETLPLSDHSPEYLEQVLTGLFGCREPENDTGRALYELFQGDCRWNCTQYIPFRSETKWSAAVFAEEGTFLSGAPEVILGNRYEEFLPSMEHWLREGCRVLLVAGYDGVPETDTLNSALVTPLAFLCLTNRLRPSAKETFSYFREQGVCIKVISGDNPLSVSAVARRAGIENAENWVDASTLTTGEDIYRAAELYTVFGRVTPEIKRALIRALKQQKHTVAMTGDGVNDVLAMKEADCGIAMASGSQAAAQIARLVLLDSDFAAMPSIVGEGRRVINNIQRASALFLVKNIFSLGLALVSFITAWPYPLETQHMSIISGLTIGVPSFFLAMEPNYERVKGRFLTSVFRRALPGGITNLLVVLTAQAFMPAFHLPLNQISVVCTAILAVVGMSVLYQVSKPFDLFRRLVWFAMAIALIFCFTVLRSIFELEIRDNAIYLIMAVLLIMIPTVFFIVGRLFDLGDRVVAKLRRK